MSRAASSAAEAARHAFAKRLRTIREDAGLTGRELAQHAGWHPSKVSKLEHGTRPPSRQDVEAWVESCSAADELPDLLAALRAVEGMYVEFRQRQRDGLRRIQREGLGLFERTQRFRIYEPGVIPGVLQTREYAEARLRRIAVFHGLPDDISEAVMGRMARQQVSRGRRLAVILEEPALVSRIGPVEVMAAQLGHLLSAALRPNVSLGIVPMNAERSMWSSPGFWIFDEAEVHLETPTAKLTITQPREIAIYARVFEELSGMALTGREARSLITAAIDRLGV